MSDNNNDDGVLLRKAETLLQGEGDERLLVAVVLLTRIVEKEWLQRFCEKHARVLVTFLVRLLQSKHDVLCRVAACGLVSKCAVFQTISAILQALVSALQRQLQLPLQRLDVDLVMALYVCMEAQQQSETVDYGAVTDMVWQRFQNTMNRNAAVSVNNIEKWESSDWMLMVQTLEALLNEQQTGLEQDWNTAVLCFLQQYGPMACMSTTTVPSFYTSLLTWTPPLYISQWHGVCLACTRTCCAAPRFSSLLRQSQNVVASALTRLLLMCMAANDDDDKTIELRILAWDTLAALVESCGWDWMLLDSNNSLGRASNLCAFMRMAAGEWRIQLGRLLEQHENNTAGDSKQTSILESCARVLLAGMAYMLQLAEMNDENGDQPLPLNNEALLHVRHSLRDALHATVEYFLLSENHSVADNNVACRVLGALLPEMLEDLPQGVDAALTALSRAMRSSAAVATRGNVMTSLLPCLASVFSAVDPSKLQQHDELVGSSFVDCMANHLREQSEKKMTDTELASSVTWSCHVLETWCDVVPPSQKQRRILSKSMLPWIQYCIETDDTSALLSTTVGCYMTLQGDAIPSSETEQQLLERALRRCAQFEQG